MSQRVQTSDSVTKSASATSCATSPQKRPASNSAETAMPQGANGLSLSPSTAATTMAAKSTIKKLGSTKKAMGQGYLRYVR